MQEQHHYWYLSNFKIKCALPAVQIFRCKCCLKLRYHQISTCPHWKEIASIFLLFVQCCLGWTGCFQTYNGQNIHKLTLLKGLQKLLNYWYPLFKSTSFLLPLSKQINIMRRLTFVNGSLLRSLRSVGRGWLVVPSDDAVNADVELLNLANIDRLTKTLTEDFQKIKTNSRCWLKLEMSHAFRINNKNKIHLC